MTISGVLGYPRIGANREWKKALESFWSGNLKEHELHDQLRNIRLNHLAKQREKGVDVLAVNDFTYYDHMLDMATMFGIVPNRFNYDSGVVPLTVYYGMARGTKDATACEMTKWFNTNYHYIVPELSEITPKLTQNRPLEAYKEAKEQLDIEGRPVIVGPLTFVRLSKGYKESEVDEWIDRLLPLYVQVLQELATAGAKWVQMDEPILVTAIEAGDMERLRRIYGTLAKEAPGIKVMLQTYFESVDMYEDVIELPVNGIGLDFVHGWERNLESIREHGFPQNKVLGAGVIDGRNIWRADLEAKLSLLETLERVVPSDRLIVQSSCSLLHVPVTVQGETKLPAVLKSTLAFADEKLHEIVLLTKALEQGRQVIKEEIEASRQALRELELSADRKRLDVQKQASALGKSSAERRNAFAQRFEAQQERWNLPMFPTTTIGSFPQTMEVRKARRLWRKGEWSDAKYDQFIYEQIDTWLKLQEKIGLDVLVHGEFERTDMVEYFGEKLAGFAFTRNGWVQSYGSRCVKSPIIYGDVSYQGEMTVQFSKYAQSRTDKPVKGMLTGPITILNWSFVREDVTREHIAYQLAYALRQEVEALEQAGIGMIQVDEPAVREGLPLKPVERPHYLSWAVHAFRIATCTVQDTTQIHTHMCYCEFHDMIDSIAAMDADVISIETSRSHGELIHHFEENTYSRGIGLGVYDIHSPRVPSVEEMTSMIDRALRVLDPRLFWINPDCGLKTRGREETVASLQNMVEAAHVARTRYGGYQ